MFEVWAFNQLYEYVEYKARAEGIDVVQVEPQYTSKRCSYCGSVGNRDEQSFECSSCGRGFVGMDMSDEAIEVTTDRLDCPLQYSQIS